MILYAPSLGVGLLSDDFVLLDAAARWQLGPTHSELFRPLPLLVWGVVDRVGGATALHVINVLLHGGVAFLVVRLMEGLLAPVLARCAGLLVLTFPASAEAVTWASGVFDVSATVLVLASVAISRRYDDRPTPRRRAALFLCGVASLLCKETAIVCPALIAVDAWARKRLRGTLTRDLVLLGVVFACVGVVRITFASAELQQVPTKYTLQRWLFGLVGGLAVPWHESIVAMCPVGVVIPVAVLIAVVAFFCTVNVARHTRAVAASASWTLLGALATLPLFFVGQDLQGSRYLYLPATGFAMALTTMAAQSATRRGRLVVALVMVGVSSLGAAGAWRHQHFWRLAAQSRDAVLERARHDHQLQACRSISLQDLPDHVEGAYVLRNGGVQALASVGITLSSDADPACAFRWSESGQTFVHSLQ